MTRRVGRADGHRQADEGAWKGLGLGLGPGPTRARTGSDSDSGRVQHGPAKVPSRHHSTACEVVRLVQEAPMARTMLCSAGSSADRRIRRAVCNGAEPLVLPFHSARQPCSALGASERTGEETDRNRRGLNPSHSHGTEQVRAGQASSNQFAAPDGRQLSCTRLARLGRAPAGGLLDPPVMMAPRVQRGTRARPARCHHAQAHSRNGQSTGLFIKGHVWFLYHLWPAADLAWWAVAILAHGRYEKPCFHLSSADVCFYNINTPCARIQGRGVHEDSAPAWVSGGARPRTRPPSCPGSAPPSTLPPHAVSPNSKMRM